MVILLETLLIIEDNKCDNAYRYNELDIFI